MDKNNIGSDHRGERDISGKRNSSLELLRLLCIFMIICHHYFVHGGFRFQAFDLTIGNAIVQCAGMYGRAACSIFAMISGYFLISGHYHFRKFISILGTMTFYSVLVYSVCSFLGIIHFSRIYFMNSFFPLFWFGNWYVQGYLLFFLFIPFVNRLLRTLNKRQYLSLLGVSYLIWTIVPSLPLMEIKWGWDNLYFFFIMYCTGAFIWLFNVGSHIQNKWNLIIGLSAGFLMSAYVIVQDLLGKHMHSTRMIREATMYMNYNYFLPVIFAVFLFIYFKNKNFYCPWINKIAASVIGIYLIHDSTFIRRWLWQVFYPNTMYVHSSKLLLIHMACKVIMVFVICLLIDQVRIHTVHRIWEKVLDKYYPQVENIGRKLGNLMMKHVDLW